MEDFRVKRTTVISNLTAYFKALYYTHSRAHPATACNCQCPGSVSSRPDLNGSRDSLWLISSRPLSVNSWVEVPLWYPRDSLEPERTAYPGGITIPRHPSHWRYFTSPIQIRKGDGQIWPFGSFPVRKDYSELWYCSAMLTSEYVSSCRRMFLTWSETPRSRIPFPS